MNRTATVVGIVALIIGLLVGYLYWGQTAGKLRADVTRLDQLVADAKQQTEDLKTRLGNAEAQVKTLGEQLQTEKDLRQKYEGMVSRGKK
jgi:cell division protein FtsB